MSLIDVSKKKKKRRAIFYFSFFRSVKLLLHASKTSLILRTILRPPARVVQVLNKEEQELAAKNEYNFDHPDAFDFELLVTVLRKLKKGKSIKVPVYDFTSHSRRKEWVSGPQE